MARLPVIWRARTRASSMRETGLDTKSSIPAARQRSAIHDVRHMVMINGLRFTDQKAQLQHKTYVNTKLNRSTSTRRDWRNRWHTLPPPMPCPPGRYSGWLRTQARGAQTVNRCALGHHYRLHLAKQFFVLVKRHPREQVVNGVIVLEYPKPIQRRLHWPGH